MNDDEFIMQGDEIIWLCTTRTLGHDMEQLELIKKANGEDSWSNLILYAYYIIVKMTLN